MFEKYSKEQKGRILDVLKQLKIEDKSVFYVFFNSSIFLEKLTLDDYIVLMKMVQEYIDNHPKELKKYLEQSLKEKEQKNNEIGFKLEYEEITPYKVLGIVEKEYTKEEMLEIVSKKIKFIKNYCATEEESEIYIDKVLDAYNEIIDFNNKKIKKHQ